MGRGELLHQDETMNTLRILGFGKSLTALLLLSCTASFGQISFSTQPYRLNTNFPTGTALLATGDLNNDGKPDVAVLNYGLGTVTILLNHGDGTLASQADFPALTPNPSGPSSFLRLVLADVNGDHNLDVVVMDQTADGSGVKCPRLLYQS